VRKKLILLLLVFIPIFFESFGVIGERGRKKINALKRIYGSSRVGGRKLKARKVKAFKPRSLRVIIPRGRGFRSGGLGTGDSSSSGDSCGVDTVTPNCRRPHARRFFS
jgi:hypothetical protein